jgi:hypothetical protein
MAGEVVGYVVEDTILCPTCAEGRGSPIFDDEEWDYIPTCEECGESLDVSPTSDGLRWLAEQFESAEEAEKKFGDVGRRWYEIAERLRIARPAETGEELLEEKLLAKMRRIEKILKRLLKG